MRHPDEDRGSDELARQRTQFAKADPDVLVAALHELRTVADHQKRREDRLKAELAKAEANHKSRERDLKRHLSSAHGALNAYRKETQRLKADLKRVRSSRSMRIGRALTSPLRISRQLLVREGHSSPMDPSATSRAVGVSEKGNPTSAPATRSVADLYADFDKQPTQETFSKVVNRLWFDHGSISDSASFVERHRSKINDLSPAMEILCQRILGEYRLQQSGATIPSRSHGPVYTPERNRVMYCVHSTPVFNSNGYSIRTKGVAEGLKSSDLDVVVVGRPGYPWDSSRDRAAPSSKRTEVSLDEVTYVHLPAPPLDRSPVDDFIMIAADAIVREARRQRPAAIQAASNYLTALPSLIAARRLGVPFLYEVRGLWEITRASTSPDWGKSERFALDVRMETTVASEADGILAITSQVAEELQRRGIDHGKIKIAPNAADPSAFPPIPRDEEYATSLDIRKDVPVLGFAGSLVAYEGLDLLLEASRLLLERGVDHDVVIAGSGAEEQNLKRQATELNLPNVRFLGRLPSKDMSRLISTFDFMPLPRRSTSVTNLVSPLKPLEAFSAMKPVVMSDVAPHLDLAGEASVRAVIFEADHADLLADAIESLISAPDYARTLARRARLWVTDERQWKHVGNIMADALREASVRHANHAPTACTRPLNELRLGLIADQFTTSSLSSSCEVIPLSRNSWRQQLDDGRLDLILIESAWEGNGGEWHRGVGYYGPDESRDLDELLAAAREQAVPTAFWNKEDPVHFARFKRTAAQCDHIFTTDSDMIPHYLAVSDSTAKSVSSLPFFAQPSIHNPLDVNRTYDHTVAYAGTYYGQRYPERSSKLLQLLRDAQPFGLTIYDRQASNPDSPYRFPAEFKNNIVGALPYEEVVASYKTHLAHLNGNSVESSPTMFSRRVVEVAASGGIALTTPSRAIDEMFGSAFASASDSLSTRSLLHDWATNPESRVHEAWRQMRTVFRAHTATSALSLIARTAGIAVGHPLLPRYALEIRNGSHDVLESVLQQSVLPARIFSSMAIPDEYRQRLERHGIELAEGRPHSTEEVDWVGALEAAVPRTHYEDLLYATFYGSWRNIAWRPARHSSQGETLATTYPSSIANAGIVRGLSPFAELDSYAQASDEQTVELLLPGPPSPPRVELGTDQQMATGTTRPTVLFAGHDLKFASTLIDSIQAAGYYVLIDNWSGHNQHDAARSERLLEQADIIIAEWGLGNAVWYSHRVRPEQRMIVRVHLQELDLPYLKQIRHSAVDQFVFVSDLIRDAAITSHGVPGARSMTLPNYVNATDLARPKQAGSEFNLGLVGIVPQRKRLDLAIDLIEELCRYDKRYRLFVKGRRPEEYSWMAKRNEEMNYYRAIYDRISTLNKANPETVVFDPHDDNMASWYSKIGIAVSVSDFESFHFTIADGAASGARPVSLAWPGADLIYPRSWLFPDVQSMAQAIANHEQMPPEPRGYIHAHFDQDLVLGQLHGVILDRDLPDRG